MEEKGKITDVCELSPYEQCRARFDAECAKAPDGKREMLEAIADIIGDVIKPSEESCRQILSGDLTLSGAYDEMEKVVRERIKPKRGEVVCGAMTDAEAKKVIIGYFGVKETTKQEKGAGGFRSVYDFL